MNYLKNVWGSLLGKLHKSNAPPKTGGFFYGGGICLEDNYRGNVFASDFVNNAIYAVTKELSKIEIRSVVESNNQIIIQNDDLTRLFRFRPNRYQTTSDFLACVEWLRRTKSNCFIYPVFTEVIGKSGNVTKKFESFYPLNPASVEVGVSPDGKTMELKMRFAENLDDFIIPYDRLIHLKLRRGNNIIFGGDGNGKTVTDELGRVVTSLDKTIQGLPKSIEASTQIKGVYSAKTMLSRDQLQNELASFEEHMYQSKSGIVAMDLAGDFTPVNLSPAQIDATTMSFLKSVIHERQGVSASILSGNYTSEEFASFYQSCLEDFMIQFEQAFSDFCFSEREKDVGHILRCYYNKVNMMTETQKMERARFAVDTGIMTLNEINTLIFGLEPFEGGDIRLRSLNYIDASIANQYQLDNFGKELSDGKESSA